ncbi:MAG: transposase, partial [Phycisphaerales bacterium]|nr:transposase [Phycisphaerales bacterium]
MGKQVYSDEFKRGAVEQVVVQRHTMSSVAKRLGVNYHTLRLWVQEAKAASG